MPSDERNRAIYPPKAWGCRCRAGESGRSIHGGQYDCGCHTYSNEGFSVEDCPGRIARSIGHRRFRGPSDDYIAQSESWELSRPGRVGHRDGDRRVGVAMPALSTRFMNDKHRRRETTSRAA